MGGQKNCPSPKMAANSLDHHKDQKEKPSLFMEVTNVEKQLVASIHAKGIMHSGVKDLYRKVCSSYEKIILNDNVLSELQDVEYGLWKLHYRHIDEFRKKIKKNSGNDETAKLMTPQSAASQRSNDDYTEGFKSFLSEAAEFYQNLISKLRRCHGIPEDFSFQTKSGYNSDSVEKKKIQKLQFLCHRFLVCLGDLARYREQCEKSDNQNHNWSVAVKHYLEAAMTWSDSGNPHNQLAVLATYVGDEFLALYHCIRSFAVKEPFPDAWNNLILLFERNRLAHLPSLSGEACFDFLKPYECSVLTKSLSTTNLSYDKMVRAGDEGLMGANLWPLTIRMISFFFLKFSLEDFPFTFASTIKELDTLMALDNVKLSVAMESYQLMDSIRTGPFRTLQVVSIFIFVIENTISSSEVKNLDNKIDTKQLTLIQMALIGTFIFIGRFVDRCLREKLLDSCPLLPALLVFVEWLAGFLDKLEVYLSDERCSKAVSYFFNVFVELLQHLDTKSIQVKPSGNVALWEDYELRGFAPLARVHLSLDFSTCRGYADSFESGNDCRVHRIVNAAMKIAEGSYENGIIFDKSAREFYVKGKNKIPDRRESENGPSTFNVVEAEELFQQTHKATEEADKLGLEENPSNPRVQHKSVAAEEEEVILFKPLTRYNSAPLHSCMTPSDQIHPRDNADQTVAADECLRRATSLLIAQNEANGGSSGLQSDLTNFRCYKPSKQQGSLVNDTVAHPFSETSAPTGPPTFSSSISTGPPSLNAWVLNRGNSGNDRVKGKNDKNKNSLAPIEEIASASLSDLSITETEDLIITSGHESGTSHYSSPVYLAPVPSAPFLPDEATWFDGIHTTFTDYNGSRIPNNLNYVFDVPQVSGYSNWTVSPQPLDYGPGIPSFIDGYTPTRRMTSSEWLRQYRESQNFERATTNHAWQVPSYANGNPGNLYGQDISRSGIYDQWGTPMGSNPLYYTETPQLLPGFVPVYGSDDCRREKAFQGYQRASPYGCGGVNEPEPLLQYLKEKERRVPQDPSLRGPPAYVGR